jgi:hypothetical protein
MGGAHPTRSFFQIKNYNANEKERKRNRAIHCHPPDLRVGDATTQLLFNLKPRAHQDPRQLCEGRKQELWMGIQLTFINKWVQYL